MLALWTRIFIFTLYAAGAMLFSMEFFPPIISIPAGLMCIGTACVTQLIETGVKFWYWWAFFGIGYKLTLSLDGCVNHSEEIDAWLEDNIKLKVSYVNEDVDYYFLFKSDLIGFKLMWAELI
jgi:hypothetical protein